MIRKAGWVPDLKEQRRLERIEREAQARRAKAIAQKTKPPTHHEVVLRVRLVVGEETSS